MEIHIEATPEIWQKFGNLALEKGKDALFAELVETAWEKAPAELKRRRGETAEEKTPE